MWFLHLVSDCKFLGVHRTGWAAARHSKGAEAVQCSLRGIHIKILVDTAHISPFSLLLCSTTLVRYEIREFARTVCHSPAPCIPRLLNTATHRLDGNGGPHSHSNSEDTQLQGQTTSGHRINICVSLRLRQRHAPGTVLDCPEACDAGRLSPLQALVIAASPATRLGCQKEGSAVQT